MKVVIAGCGYVGSALAGRLLAEGHSVQAIRRSPGAGPSGIQAVAADLTDPASLAAVSGEPDLAVFAAAGARDEAGYRALYVEGLRNVLRVLQPRRTLFVSSTAVYEQRDGGWVDEETPVSPRGYRGRVHLEAEQVLADAAGTGVAVRFGGIYGPGRGRLIEAIRSGRARSSPERFTNRIHRDDCAGVLAHLAVLPDPAPLYLGVDSDPASEREVYAWPAERLGVPEPPRASEPARGANKRCSNALLRASGYRFLYPSFRQGYAGLV